MNITEEKFECHGHMLMDGTEYRQARARHERAVDEAVVREEFRALQEAGVRYFRDGGDANHVSVTAREIAPEYGIDFVSPIFAIHRESRYGGIVGLGFSDLKEYRKRVDEVKKAQGDFIKLIVSGIVTFKQYGELSCPTLEKEEITETVRIAKEEGFAVMVHVNGADAVRAVTEAGADSIEHGCFMDKETIEALAGSDTVWVPTIAAIEAFVGRAGFDPEVSRLTFEKHMEAVRFAAEKGVKIAAGSDSGAVGVPHGRGTVREYELLREAGVSDAVILEGNKRIQRVFR